MNAADAIQAHLQCTARLTARLKRMRHIDGADGQCEFLRWVRKSETRLGHLPEFSAVRRAHETFHIVAAGLAQRLQADALIDVDREFGTHTNLGAASSSVPTAIRILEKRVRAAGASHDAC